MKKKNLPQNITSSNVNKDVKASISDADFTFVQADKSIHDTKFQSKPTTFMKDAMHRFRKNHSSVIAGCILAVLIGMAILVPVLDGNDIESSQAYARYLPPKWFAVNDAGFLDGTTSVSEIIAINKNGGSINADTPLDDLIPNTASYKEDCIVDHKINYTKTTFSASSPYGWGGSYFLSAGNHTQNALWYSSAASFDTSISDYTVTLSLDPEKTARNTLELNYAPYADVYYSGLDNDPTHVYLCDFLSDNSGVTVSNVSSTILSNRPTSITDTTFMTRFGIEIKTNTVYEDKDIGNYPFVFINSYTILSPSTSSANQPFVNVGFTDANEVGLRLSSEDASTKARCWRSQNNAITSLDGVNVYFCSFRYDSYKAAFGNYSALVTELDMNNYIAKGYCEYDPTVGISSFKILSDSCPIEEVTLQNTVKTVIVNPDGTKSYTYTYSYQCTICSYKLHGYSSMPYFIFGTDASGFDYFKYLFSGLRTSLMLGVLCAAINITVGLIWGAISGYFGGWVDMLMERFTEILGGVPWLVMMTLCIVLLGQTFWVFLLALCLTGWMGVAGMTRSQFYRYKGREYVLASRTLGASDTRLIFKHILPNAVGPIVTGSVLLIPSVIFDEASVSFLGLGLKGFKSFGVALSDAQKVMSTAPYMIVCGSIIVSLLMICFNLFGNGLRDAFNPSLKGVDE
jgi:ABC-type dipeptide/oligopeptide/nickel transport system permease subunit